jgi:outer membrane immunogenic protein
MKNLFLVAASILAFSTTAHAADLPLPVKAPVYAPLPEPVLTWAGSYIGILGGVARHDGSLDPNCANNIGCSTIDLARTGGTVGALLGHNWQQGSFVYGLEGDWSGLSGVRASEGNAALSTSFDVRWVATARGRAGLALDATLVYITGGLAFGRVDNSLTANGDDGDLTGIFIDNKTRLGWTAGVGVEHMLSPHWTVRGEWRYVDLGTHDAQCTHGNDACAGVHVNFSNTLMLGLVGLAYKF